VERLAKSLSEIETPMEDDAAGGNIAANYELLQKRDQVHTRPEEHWCVEFFVLCGVHANRNTA